MFLLGLGVVWLLLCTELRSRAGLTSAKPATALLQSAQNKWTRLASATTAAVLPNQGTAYRPDACAQLKAAYAARIGGQDAQLTQIANTICRHIRADHHTRPLVIALTGPVGVGKSWTTRVTAQALFSREAVLPQRCEATRAPCRALLQIGSYSFVAAAREERFEQLRSKVAEHVRRFPEALIVLEEFDRMECGLRDMIREVIEHGPAHGLYWTRAVVMLTTNVGVEYFKSIARDRAKDASAWPESELQQLIAAEWRTQCQHGVHSGASSPASQHNDTDADESAAVSVDAKGMVGQARMLKVVDRVLAFTALTQADIAKIYDLLLTTENNVRMHKRYQLALPQHERLLLRWDAKVTRALALNKQNGGYSGGFANQGAAKCNEVLGQLLDDLIHSECPSHGYAYRLRSTGSAHIGVECEVVELALPHAEL